MKTKALFMLLAIVVLLAACKSSSKSNYESGRSSTADTAYMAKDTASAEVSRLVKTADITFKVKNVLQTGESVAALTTQYGGMIMHHQMHTIPQQNRNIHISTDSVLQIASFDTNADMIIRIPPAKLEDFLNKVSKMGIYVTSSKMDIEDKSLDYLASALKAGNRQELVRQQKAGLVKIKDPGAVVALKDDLVDQQIGNKRIDEGVKYSVISLNFYQSNAIYRETVANDDPSAYNLPFFNRFLLALTDGWNTFVDLLIVMANLWVFIAAGLAAWFGYKTYRKKMPLISKPAV